jgi:DNA-binding HxlR family transcriptional regulator
MKTPKPGAPVRGSTTGRPVMALLDLLGRRWTMRILWELRASPLTFRELRERCDAMSPSVLNDRLAELREAGFVAHAEGSGYALTPRGSELGERLVGLDEFARRWAGG